MVRENLVFEILDLGKQSLASLNFKLPRQRYHCFQQLRRGVGSVQSPESGGWHPLRLWRLVALEREPQSTARRS